MEILVDDAVTTSTPTPAAIVEAGTLGTVIVTALLYDPDTAADNGCDPAGCIGDFTRVSLDTIKKPKSFWTLIIGGYNI